eukprot:CAMPEP_0119562998 /NCGR_PEP_ID=MMETSP1352-20130426/22194_1 /TAXON_ID=265584 /ORGANISM="Stauroneis constricta, Strain CCMP1120" /LENGTH=38 /DNA_ID= /DNA_START= /DNA_END= /DNA_ORIENTATION=
MTDDDDNDNDDGDHHTAQSTTPLVTGRTTYKLNPIFNG